MLDLAHQLVDLANLSIVAWRWRGREREGGREKGAGGGVGGGGGEEGRQSGEKGEEAAMLTTAGHVQSTIQGAAGAYVPPLYCGCLPQVSVCTPTELQECAPLTALNPEDQPPALNPADQPHPQHSPPVVVI